MKKLKSNITGELLVTDPSKNTTISDIASTGILDMNGLKKLKEMLNAPTDSLFNIPPSKYEDMVDSQNKFFAAMDYGSDNIVKYEGKWISKEEAFFRDLTKL